jgi:hypothetical protein
VIDLDPVCARCFDLMITVVVHHKHRPATRWPLCPHCVTTRHLDLADLPMDVAEPRPARHLRAVP